MRPVFGHTSLAAFEMSANAGGIAIVKESMLEVSDTRGK